MVKLAFGKGASRFASGVGIADTIAPEHRTQGKPVWLNIDLLSYEYRGPSGLFFGYAIGMTTIVGGGSVTIFADEGRSEITSGPQFRLEGGVQF